MIAMVNIVLFFTLVMALGAALVWVAWELFIKKK
jgi:hypothetical protein